MDYLINALINTLHTHYGEDAVDIEVKPDGRYIYVRDDDANTEYVIKVDIVP